MPQLGESVHEGTISRWLVHPGERVVEFEPMLEVDTDKVNAEVPSPVTGILREILALEGETVRAGAEIAVIEVDDLTVPATTRPADRLIAAVHQGTEGALGLAQASAATAFAPPRPRHLSPGVLRLVEEHGVDVTQVRGSGNAGRITAKDVREYIKGRAHPVASPAIPGPAVAFPVPVHSKPPDAPVLLPSEERLRLTPNRRLIAERMVWSKMTIPHAWQTHDVDMAGVVANRTANKDRFLTQEGLPLTYLPYVIAAAAAGLREHRLVNSSLNGDHIVIHRNINIGIVVGPRESPFVSIIREANELSVVGIARALGALTSRARTTKPNAEELAEATFTVSDAGAAGSIFSYSVINPGQVAILTMGAVTDRPVAIDGMLAVRPMMYLSMSIDHRVLDGLQAATYLVGCRRWLEGVREDTAIA